MQESGMVLVHRFGFGKEAHFQYIEKIIGRFRNPYLTDEVSRVGREPIRKLSAGDRLLSPLTGAAELGLPHGNLVKGVAAALHYDFPEDAQSVELQGMIARDGIAQAIPEVTGLDAGNSLVQEIEAAYFSAIAQKK